MSEIDNILKALIAERDRLNLAIQVLQGAKTAQNISQPPEMPEPAVGRKWGEDQRRAQSERMRKLWRSGRMMKPMEPEPKPD